jgi:hypothetical protein
MYGNDYLQFKLYLNVNNLLTNLFRFYVSYCDYAVRKSLSLIKRYEG